jgi:V8-like Glu-specific endopeptidase
MAGRGRVGCRLLLGVGLWTLTSGVPAAAMDVPGIKAQGQANYWTPDRMRNAQPMTLPSITNAATRPAPPPLPQPTTERRTTRASRGHRPTDRIAPNENNRLFKPKRLRSPADRAASAAVPEAAGVEPAHYSSSRIVPQSADSAYPYSTVGRLFFTVPVGADDNPGDRFCSASVIARRVVLTAGHCLHSGKNGADGWFTNWRFVPAFRDGLAPYGSWDWSEAKVTTTWLESQGVLPNAADYGLLVFADHEINGRTRKLGNTVGTLGVDTNQLIPNHVHMLAYPCNIDSCNKMHQVTAQSYRASEPNNVEYGSDMGIGSSGGPWVQNFGIPGMGQVQGVNNTAMNRVVGLTSYGFNSTSLLLQGSPILDNRLWDLWDQVCAGEGNC